MLSLSRSVTDEVSVRPLRYATRRVVLAAKLIVAAVRSGIFHLSTHLQLNSNHPVECRVTGEVSVWRNSVSSIPLSVLTEYLYSAKSVLIIYLRQFLSICYSMASYRIVSYITCD